METDINCIEQCKFKLLLLGETGVGKTSIVQCFITSKQVKNTVATCGVDFYSQNIEINKQNKESKKKKEEKVKVNLQIWDTAGQERYQVLGKQYLNGVMGVIVVFGYDNVSSIEQVKKWMEYIEENGDQHVEVVLVGNKSDLIGQQAQQVTQTHIDACLQKHPRFNQVHPVSAYSTNNISSMFNTLAQQIYQRYQQLTPNQIQDSIFATNRKSYQLQNTPKSHKSCCSN